MHSDQPTQHFGLLDVPAALQDVQRVHQEFWLSGFCLNRIIRGKLLVHDDCNDRDYPVLIVVDARACITTRGVPLREAAVIAIRSGVALSLSQNEFIAVRIIQKLLDTTEIGDGLWSDDHGSVGATMRNPSDRFILVLRARLRHP